MYRLLMNLSMPDGRILPQGSLQLLDELSDRVVRALLDAERIAPVSAPPLAALPGWTGRARILAKAGLRDPLAFLRTDVAELAVKLDRREDELRQWQREARALLMAPPPNPAPPRRILTRGTTR